MDNKNHREDDYLAMSKYLNHSSSDQFPGFGTFEEDGHFYFIMLDKSGNAFMRSEGYSSAKARENGINSVLKNRPLEERWRIEEQMKKFFLCLKAGNHQEIAKSGAYDTEAAASSALANWLGKAASGAGMAAGIAATGIAGKLISENRRVISETRNELPLGKVLEENRRVIGETKNEQPLGKVLEENRKVIGEERKVIGETRNQIGEKRNLLNENRNLLTSTRAGTKEDDYLKCDAYKGHKVTDTVNNIAFFQAQGQDYFVVYNEDGSVRLRSEGFTDIKNRDSELKAVIKYLNNADRYTTMKRGKYFYHVLKDEKGREVARSCMSTKAGYTVPYVAPVIAAASIARKEAVTAAAAAPYVVAADGCLKLWWLPLLFLLIPIFFHLGGCEKEEPVPEPEPVVEKVVPPPPPPPPVCKCEDLTHPIFKIPPGPAPKTTTVLGRAPEYGNSHSLDAAGFYNKLNGKFRDSQMEKDFLNGIFKQMGYENGWADATPELFTAVEVPRGVSGNLGTKVTHKTVYRKLDPTNVRDLKAFRIEAKNACHLHFMKTCGNHFFFGDCE